MHESHASPVSLNRAARAAGPRPGRCRLLAVALAAVALLSACSSLQPLPHKGGQSAAGSWLELIGPTTAQVSPGVVLELPRAPYRAQFADDKGIYYQATASLVYRTEHGVTSVVSGGLYAPYAEPGQAQAWTEPLFGAATLPHPNRWPVKRWSPSSR